MSGINQISGNVPIQPVTPAPVYKSAASPAAAETAGPDTVELSSVNQYVQSLQTNNIRADKVQEIRGQIANGTYESDDKLNAALDGLLDDLTT